MRALSTPYSIFPAGTHIHGNSTFNAQDSRLIIVIVELGSEKIYVAAYIPSSSGGVQEKGKTG